MELSRSAQQSGTGKTAVFAIASLQLLDETSRDVQVLVLSPTRELAEQSQRVMQSLGDFMNVRNSIRTRRMDRGRITNDGVVAAVFVVCMRGGGFTATLQNPSPYLTLLTPRPLFFFPFLQQPKNIFIHHNSKRQVNCHACIGGKSLGNDMKELERGGVQVVSGTPGRVYDLVRRNALQMGRLKAMVLDEADEMLSRGFKEQIYDIYRCVYSHKVYFIAHVCFRLFFVFGGRILAS